MHIACQSSLPTSPPHSPHPDFGGTLSGSFGKFASTLMKEPTLDSIFCLTASPPASFCGNVRSVRAKHTKYSSACLPHEATLARTPSSSDCMSPTHHQVRTLCKRKGATETVKLLARKTRSPHSIKVSNIIRNIGSRFLMSSKHLMQSLPYDRYVE